MNLHSILSVEPIKISLSNSLSETHFCSYSGHLTNISGQVVAEFIISRMHGHILTILATDQTCAYASNCLQNPYKDLSLCSTCP